MHYPFLWDPYIFITDDDFVNFWRNHLVKSDRMCFILGKGFDARMTKGIKTIFQNNSDWKGYCEVILIDLDEGKDSPSVEYMQQVDENYKNLIELLNGNIKTREKKIKIWEGEGFEKHRVGHSEIPKSFANENYCDFSDIIIDISSLPRSIYFTLINLIYSKTKRCSSKLVNFHVIDTENILLDMYTHCEGVEEEAYILPGYMLDSETEEELTVIWIPLLGSGESTRLERIYDKINPTEICPVLPSPSTRPKHSEELLVEYRQLLFDTWDIEAKNIVYASEINPFDVYRQITKIALQYDKSLKLIGRCKIIISALSSKLMSLGALMAAYDLKNNERGIKISVAHVDCLGYTLDPKYHEVKVEESKICSLWFGGDPYSEVE